MEERLLEILNSATDEFQLMYCAATLGYVGTRKAVPDLTKMLSHKKEMVSGAALWAILQMSTPAD